MPRHKTEYQIRDILKHNRDGSSDRQKARHQSLMRIVKALQDRGYSKRWDVHKIGAKEAHRLIHDWKTQGLTPRTIANRMADVRWLASKVAREDKIPDNKALGVGRRSSQPGFGENKADVLRPEHLAKMDERMQLINQLKAEFGLREKEAIKFQHRYATGASNRMIRLQGSWTKGGRPREIVITNDRQRSLLERVGKFQRDRGERSMIPAGRKYLNYKKDVQAKSTEIGIKGHGFRHHWAQQRFEQVSGIKPPLAGGPDYSSLNAQEKAQWSKAARIVNLELGHGKGREDITATYIGGRS